MTRLTKNQKETVKNPVWLCQQVFYGRSLMRNEVQAVISFALDNLMDFDDIPEVWERLFTEVVKQKKAHYQDQCQYDYSQEPRYA